MIASGKNPKSAPVQRDGYHHGNLVEALIAATIEIIEEKGVEQVSVREAAKRAGVSPGAPFRHFRTKTALMTAVAEQAMSRLKSAVMLALAQADRDDPIAGIEAIGLGYLRWAVENPTHFQIISSRSLIDFPGSNSLSKDNEDIRNVMIDLLIGARDQDRLRHGIDFNYVILSARAFVYGLARMWIDGHFPEWHVSEPYPDAMQQSLKLFIRLITKDV